MFNFRTSGLPLTARPKHEKKVIDANPWLGLDFGKLIRIEQPQSYIKALDTLQTNASSSASRPPLPTINKPLIVPHFTNKQNIVSSTNTITSFLGNESNLIKNSDYTDILAQDLSCFKLGGDNTATANFNDLLLPIQTFTNDEKDVLKPRKVLASIKLVDSLLQTPKAAKILTENFPISDTIGKTNNKKCDTYTLPSQDASLGIDK
ncbi:unnamed protein product [Gordionus sp. m RMFG-2023]